MKKALLLLLSLTMLAPLGATSALAHPAPGPHYHPAGPARVHRVKVRRYRPYGHWTYRRRRPPVVVVTPAPPPPVVVVEQAPPPPRRVTVVRRNERAVVKRRAPEPEERTLIGLGIRLSGATLDGEKLGLDSAENPTMGGFGLQFRTRFTDSLGLELSTDFLTGSGDNFDQTTVTPMASLTYHLFPKSRFQPYALAGLGVHFTRLSYLDGRYNYDITEFAGQVGAGLEVFLTENIAINADLRFQTVFKNMDTQAKIRTDCLNQVGDMVGFCDNIHQADPDDKMNLGIQFHAGASWYF